MNTDWQPLADSLRNELQEYGALLALFDEQQESILHRDSEKIIAAVAALEAQTLRIRAVKSLREEHARFFARTHNRPVESTLRDLITSAPSEARPLLEALIDEINHLIHRSRRRSRQNHQLLARAVEVRQEILQTLRPGTFTKTYSRRGQVAVSAPSLAPAYKAAG